MQAGGVGFLVNGLGKLAGQCFLVLRIGLHNSENGRFSSGNYYSYGPLGTFTAIELPR